MEWGGYTRSISSRVLVVTIGISHSYSMTFWRVIEGSTIEWAKAND